MHHKEVPNIADECNSLSEAAAKVQWIAAAVGLVALVGATAIGWSNDQSYLLHTYLTSYVFYLSISLGGLFFAAVQHASRAGWSASVRRIAEVLSGTLPLMAILSLPILVSLLMKNTSLYPWTDPEYAIHHPVVADKAAWLNVPFFVARCVGYFVVWIVLAWFFLSRSLKQDQSGDKTLTLSMERWSYVSLLLFALTITFAALDLLMSLSPEWFSTIFGVYYFAGSLVGSIAAIIVVAFVLQKNGVAQKAITVEHYHELGKLLFAFVVFWGYIAFSQYMLIWYANIPEETGWYLRRQTGFGVDGVMGPWAYVSLFLVFGHLLIPFVGLMSRHVKRNKLALTAWAVWLLAIHWVDMYWLVMPGIQQAGVPFGLLDVLCFLGLGGLFVAGTLWVAGTRCWVAIKDPRLNEALLFENQ